MQPLNLNTIIIPKNVTPETIINPTNSIPAEILEKIFSFLDLPSFLNALHTCTLWNFTLNSQVEHHKKFFSEWFKINNYADLNVQALTGLKAEMALYMPNLIKRRLLLQHLEQVKKWSEECYQEQLKKFKEIKDIGKSFLNMNDVNNAKNTGKFLSGLHFRGLFYSDLSDILFEKGHVDKSIEFDYLVSDGSIDLIFSQSRRHIKIVDNLLDAKDFNKAINIACHIRTEEIKAEALGNILFALDEHGEDVFTFLQVAYMMPDVNTHYPRREEWILRAAEILLEKGHIDQALETVKDESYDDYKQRFLEKIKKKPSCDVFTILRMAYMIPEDSDCFNVRVNWILEAAEILVEKGAIDQALEALKNVLDKDDYTIICKEQVLQQIKKKQSSMVINNDA